LALCGSDCLLLFFSFPCSLLQPIATSLTASPPPAPCLILLLKMSIVQNDREWNRACNTETQNSRERGADGGVRSGHCSRHPLCLPLVMSRSDAPSLPPPSLTCPPLCSVSSLLSPRRRFLLLLRQLRRVHLLDVLPVRAVRPQCPHPGQRRVPAALLPLCTLRNLRVLLRKLAANADEREVPAQGQPSEHSTGQPARFV